MVSLALLEGQKRWEAVPNKCVATATTTTASHPTAACTVCSKAVSLRSVPCVPFQVRVRAVLLGVIVSST